MSNKNIIKRIISGLPLAATSLIGTAWGVKQAISSNPELSGKALEFVDKNSDRLWSISKIGLTACLATSSYLLSRDKVDGNFWNHTKDGWGYSFSFSEPTLFDKIDYIWENASTLFILNLPSLSLASLSCFCIYRFRDTFFED
ncbi:MAG: hypothetical protein GWP59_03100 [Chlamydiales bacterium]|nr:hypothetical protein [Chlamydiales bacterium]NCF70672.1 hypothetical protein [Chlamydiales bacterium]